jgi:hypothetical protein
MSILPAKGCAPTISAFESGCVGFGLNGRLDTGLEVGLLGLDVAGNWIGAAGFGLNGRFETGFGDANALLDGDADDDGRADRASCALKGDEMGLEVLRGLFGVVGVDLGVSKNGISMLGSGEPIRAFKMVACVSASIGEASSKSPNSSSSSTLTGAEFVVNSSYGFALRMASRLRCFGVWRAVPDGAEDVLACVVLSSDPNAANRSWDMVTVQLSRQVKQTVLRSCYVRYIVTRPVDAWAFAVQYRRFDESRKQDGHMDMKVTHKRESAGSAHKSTRNDCLHPDLPLSHCLVASCMDEFKSHVN